MNLFTKYNRFNLLVSVIIFIFFSLVFYFFFKIILISQVDSALEIEKKEIESYVQQHGQLPQAYSVNDQRIQFSQVSDPIAKTSFRTLLAYDTTEKENGNFREILFGLRVADQEYKISVIKSLEASDDLLHSVWFIMLPAILLMSVATYVINRIIQKRLWKPFYDTVHKLKLFSIGKNNPLQFQPTDVDEFKILNNTLETTTGEAQKDYLLLKEFTENASHEMQTPLAIIQSKLDLLIQDENLSESQSVAVQTVYESIQQLNHLNQSLLLLAKIGNGQFQETNVIALQEKIQEKSEAFQELWSSKEITVNTSLEKVLIKMNPALADILLNNLLSNATRHNSTRGRIEIELTEGSLTINNTGTNGAALDKNLVFTRFYTANNGLGNNGLGLSIIKQICEASGFHIAYAYQAPLHSFVINWTVV